MTRLPREGELWRHMWFENDYAEVVSVSHVNGTIIVRYKDREQFKTNPEVVDFKLELFKTYFLPPIKVDDV